MYFVPYTVQLKAVNSAHTVMNEIPVTVSHLNAEKAGKVKQRTQTVKVPAKDKLLPLTQPLLLLGNNSPAALLG